MDANQRLGAIIALAAVTEIRKQCEIQAAEHPGQRVLAEVARFARLQEQLLISMLEGDDERADALVEECARLEVEINAIGVDLDTARMSLEDFTKVEHRLVAQREAAVWN